MSMQRVMDAFTWKPDQKPGPSTSTGNGSSKSTFYTSQELGFENDFVPRPQEAEVKSPPALDSKQPVRKVKSDSQSSAKSASYSGLVDAAPSRLNCYVVRLNRGEELRRTLLKFAEIHGLKGAFVMSCCGSATSAKLRMASYDASQQEANYMLDLVNPTEIVSVSGTISGGGHLHASLADHTGKMIGGHVLELMIDTTAEVVIGECISLAFNRQYDPSTGFKELVVETRE